MSSSGFRAYSQRLRRVRLGIVIIVGLIAAIGGFSNIVDVVVRKRVMLMLVVRRLVHLDGEIRRQTFDIYDHTVGMLLVLRRSL